MGYVKVGLKVAKVCRPDFEGARRFIMSASFELTIPVPVRRHFHRATSLNLLTLFEIWYRLHGNRQTFVNATNDARQEYGQECQISTLRMNQIRQAKSKCSDPKSDSVVAEFNNKSVDPARSLEMRRVMQDAMRRRVKWVVDHQGCRMFCLVYEAESCLGFAHLQK
jgi:hypothetical protein